MNKKLEFSGLMSVVDSLGKSVSDFCDFKVIAKSGKNGDDFRIAIDVDHGKCLLVVERKNSQVSISSNTITMDYPPIMSGDFRISASMTIHVWYIYSYCLKKVALRDLDVTDVLDRIETKLFVHLYLSKGLIEEMALEKIIPDLRATKIAVEGLRILHPELIDSVIKLSSDKTSDKKVS